MQRALLQAKAKLADVELLGSAGWVLIVVTGGPMLIVQVNVTGVVSAFPAASVAWTVKVC